MPEVNITYAKRSSSIAPAQARAARRLNPQSGLAESSAQLLLPSFAFRIRDEYSASRGLGHDQLAFERDLRVDWNVGSARKNAGKNPFVGRNGPLSEDADRFVGAEPRGKRFSSC